MSVLPLLPFVAVVIPENCHFAVVIPEFQKFSRGDRSNDINGAQRGLSPPLRESALYHPHALRWTAIPSPSRRQVD